MAPLNFRLSIGIRFCNRKLVFFSHLGYPKIQVVSATTVCALGNSSGNEKFCYKKLRFLLSFVTLYQIFLQ